MLRSTRIAALIAHAGLASSGLGADLRIETRVYAGPAPAVVGESLTCFRDGVVYDFRDADDRVTIFRGETASGPARFVLLDTAGKRRTSMDAEQVTAAVGKLERWARSQADPVLRFSGNPAFTETYDADTGELRLTADQLSYRLVTMPLKKPEIRLELRQFLDGFARLQTLLDAGLPPGPRLRVNEALFRHSAAPLEVELSVGDQSEPTLRAEHSLSWVLSKQDLLRIDVVGDQLASFQRVSNAEFQQARLRAASAAAVTTAK